MPSLNIFPRRSTDTDVAGTLPQEERQTPQPVHAESQIRDVNDDPGPAPFSPVAPDYSPITPRAQPVLPAAYDAPPEGFPVGAVHEDAHGPTDTHARAIVKPAVFTASPPPHPFSSKDSTDAVALRAAISSLQFQKQKAQNDIHTLEKIKKEALDDPKTFTTELAAGRLREQRQSVGNLQAMLDGVDSDDEGENAKKPGHQSSGSSSEPPTSLGEASGAVRRFDSIPGPQNVVRMPYINWDKYHVAGDVLESMHDQQRRWPGNFAYGTDRGREHTVAAPYSPWLDSLEGQAQHRWEGVDRSHDNLAPPSTAATPTVVSEHPMETRQSGAK